MDEKKKGTPPQYTNNGIGVWLHKTKEGEIYLSIKMVGHEVVNAFKNKPKPKPTIPEEEVL